MARPVAPWVWRRMLRDHWPGHPSALFTMLILGTYMDREGIAWPSQSAIARGIRSTARTVQRHIADARRRHWLLVAPAGRGGQGWRHNAYQCACPDDLPLDANGEDISGALEAQVGNIEGDDISLSSRPDV